MRGAGVLAIVGACGFAPASFGDTPTTDGSTRRVDAAIDAFACPADFAALAGSATRSTYKLYNYAADASDARQPFDMAITTCSAQGAHLAIVDGPAEAGAIAAVIVTDPSFPYYAEGLTDAAVEGTWLTVLGGVPDYLPWDPGQPDGAGGGDGDCAVVDLGGNVYDYYCDAAHPYAFACECEPAGTR